MTSPSTIELSAEARGDAPGRQRLTGRRILVVGGGQADHGDDDGLVGNGRAISILLGREGASVVVADLDLDSAERTAEMVRAAGAKAHAIAADATSDADVQRMVDESRALLGGLDGLVLNVGIDGGHRIAGTDAATWDRVFAVNARSHFLCCKYAVPVMEPRSSVVLISSTSAFSASGEVPAMSASKAALSTLALHVARENAVRQVRCNVVAPGLIDTPLGRSGGRKRAARNEINIPMGRYGTAWDVAYLVNFLVSDESTYMTGQTIFLDGGRMVR